MVNVAVRQFLSNAGEAKCLYRSYEPAGHDVEEDVRCLESFAPSCNAGVKMTESIPVREPDKIRFDLNTGCWLWTGSLNSSGYGPHRRIYEYFMGPVAKDIELDHTCRRRNCINFNHLEPVTPLINCHRGKGYKCTPEWFERLKAWI